MSAERMPRRYLVRGLSRKPAARDSCLIRQYYSMKEFSAAKRQPEAATRNGNQKRQPEAAKCRNEEGFAPEDAKGRRRSGTADAGTGGNGDLRAARRMLLCRGMNPIDTIKRLRLPQSSMISTGPAKTPPNSCLRLGRATLTVQFKKKHVRKASPTGA